MRLRLIGLLSWAAFGCTRPPPPAPPPEHSAPPTSADSARPPSRPGTELHRTFTGRARPLLVLENGFPIVQHVFIDWVQLAALAPGASQLIELDPGTHTVTCADSADPDDHPAAVSESFESGYTYAYKLRPAPP